MIAKKCRYRRKLCIQRDHHLSSDDGTRDVYKLTKFSAKQPEQLLQPETDRIQRRACGERDEVIADGPSTSNGEMALGKNPLIGFMTWEGYNYEDAVLLSERLVQDDVYTSVHIEEYEAEAQRYKARTGRDHQRYSGCRR